MGATVYGFFLRQELDRVLKDDPGTTRVKRTVREIRALVAEFFPVSTSETKDRGVATTILYELAGLGFVRRIPDSGEGNETVYELTRLLRAKFNPSVAREYLDRIRAHIARKQT